MRREDLLLTLIVALIITTATTLNLPATTAQGQATIAVTPLLIDTRNLKEIGDTFSINITLANVASLWGYEATLRYNSSVISATSNAGLDSRFTLEYASEIGGDYTHVSRGTFNGDLEGVTTTAPLPVERIEFVVTGSGTTNITLDPTPPLCQLASITGEVIPSALVSGRFSNTEQLATHDVGVTTATLNATSAKPGDKITITATIANLGDFNENVTVIVKFNRTETNIEQIGTEQKITDLAQGGNEQVTIIWDTAGVEAGKYQVTIEATVAVDDNIADNTHSTIVTLSSGGGGGIPMEYIYIGVGIAIVVIALIAAFALRSRK